VKKTPLFLLLLTALISSLHASILVDEGFNFGSTDTNLQGLSGGGSIGVSAGGWTGTNGSTSSAVSQYLASGLSMGDMTVVGGMAQETITNSGQSAGAAIRLTTASNYTGTLYGSYLFNDQSIGSSAAAPSVTSLLINTNPSSGDSSSPYDLASKDYNATNGGVRLGTSPQSNNLLTGTAITLNTTYLMAFQITGLGTTNQSITSWILNTNNFTTAEASGFTTAALNANNLQTGFVTNTAANGFFSSNSYLKLFAYTGNTSSVVAGFDELKFSDTSLNEAILGVPEPSSIAYLLGGLGLLLAVHIRNKKQLRN
jgi:hypothetical protein